MNETSHTESQATLLLVDDEPNILSALKRLFRPLGYRILTAESGDEGLEWLEREPVDLVLSDMRMPGMSGAEFLEQVRARWPETVRLLLTGFADIASTIDAINRGEISRYIAKPWDDNEIVLIVRQALERQALERETRRLEELTRRQNEELKALNAELEERVKARTEELRLTLASLQGMHDKLKKSFFASIQVFANLMELREGPIAGHARRVAELAQGLARRLELPGPVVQDVVVAALLHDIGKLGLPDHLLEKPFSALAPEEHGQVVRHPAKGAALLMSLDALKEPCKLIHAHHERFDGQGFPDGISGLAIPLGARILAVANDYDNLLNGLLVAKAMNRREALDFIIEARGKRYDPTVADAFVEWISQQPEVQQSVPETVLSTAQLSAGMIVSRDVTSRDGLLLLSRDYVLDESVIQQIKSFEKSEGQSLAVHVRTDSLPGKGGH